MSAPGRGVILRVQEPIERATICLIYDSISCKTLTNC